MRNGFLQSVAALLAGTGLVLAQAPPAKSPVAVPEPPLFSAEKASAPVKPGDAAAALLPEKPGVKPAEKLAGKHPVKADTHCPDLCVLPCCDPCGPPGKCWVSVEYLLWWIRPGQTPPLVTTSPASSLGILGQPGTQTIIGGDSLDRDPLHGGRFAVGTWLDCGQTKGIEIGGYILSNRSTELSASGPGTPGSITLARPFFDILTGRENSELVALPGVLAGTVTVNATSRLMGLTPNIICNLCCCNPKDCCDPRGYRIDLVVGPRFQQLEEDITIRENLRVDPSVAVLGGSRINIQDTFDTENRFYGGYVGGRAEFWRDRLFVNVSGGLGIGSTHQIVRINGTTTIAPPGAAAVTRTGGLLTQQSNIGRYSRQEFSLKPDIGLNIGYQVTPTLRAFVGYTLIYWTDVVRPGDQIDRALNTTQLPTLSGPGTLSGPARPAFRFVESDFWAQGISAGIQLRF